VDLPRYFTPRPGAEPKDAPGGVQHAVDAFALQFGATRAVWLAGIDHAGEFDVQRLGALDGLPPQIRSALTFHEVAHGDRRVLTLESVFLFEMRLLEQMPDCPGVNDPVRLYGTLVGPLASDPSRFPPIQRLEGHLTVSRGDVLAGLVAGARWAFRCADTNGHRSSRVFGMLLGADRYDAVAAGRGAVIVYPMLGLDGDLYGETPGNEEIVSRVLYDLLHAWWTDAAREAPPALRSPDALPVPSRSQHEQQLAREGFKIKRDVAVRTRAGWAGALPGPLGRESRPIPPEGATDDFLQLAVEALVDAPEWPSPSVTALCAFVRDASANVRKAPAPQIPGRKPIDFLTGRVVPEWMQQQIAAGATGRSRLTPGPNDPSAPRALQPLDAETAEKAATVLDLLASRFDRVQ